MGRHLIYTTTPVYLRAISFCPRVQFGCGFFLALVLLFDLVGILSCPLVWFFCQGWCMHLWIVSISLVSCACWSLLISLPSPSLFTCDVTININNYLSSDYIYWVISFGSSPRTDQEDGCWTLLTHLILSIAPFLACAA